MKKSITLLTLLSGLSFAFGQGQVAFMNTASTLISTNGLPPGPPVGVMSGTLGLYQFGLFWAPTGTTDPLQFQFSGFYGTNLSSPGRFNGGAGTASSPPIQGQPAGTEINVLVRGWSADPELGTPVNGDSTVWDKVALVVYGITGPIPPVSIPPNWLYGESGIATVILGGGALPIPTPFGSGAGQISSGFILHPIIPEPATVSLLVLGSAAADPRACKVFPYQTFRVYPD